MSFYKKLLAALMIAAFLLLSAACATTPSASAGAPEEASTLTRYRTSFIGVFDTLTTVIGYAEDEETFNEYSAFIKDKLTFYHRLFNTYDAFEGVVNLKVVNETAGSEPVKVDPEIIALLKQSLRANELSGGNVNVAFGAVLKIWHEYRETGINAPERASVPERSDLEAAALHTDIRDIVIDEEASTVYFRDPDLRLDVGSGAKGYATEQAALQVEAMGLRSAVISVGGNIRTIGRRPDSDTPWRIGIQNPDKTVENQVIEILAVEDMSVVTSGVYERFYEVDGVRYHHIIDPETLFPEETFDAVTIVTPSSALADSFTTALFNMDLEDGMALIESLENAEAMWLTGDERRMTDGFDRHIAKD